MFSSVVILAAMAVAGPGQGDAGVNRQPATRGCADPSPDALTFVDLPGRPFQAVPTADGCWIFVSLPQARDSAGGIAVVSRAGGRTALVRTIPLEAARAGTAPKGLAPSGMVVTNDGELLVAAAGPRVAFVDVARAISGDSRAVLGYWDDGLQTASRVYVNVTADDRHLFVSEEGAGTIALIDLVETRQSRFRRIAIIGRIPVGQAPIALTFSHDERYLFTTVQTMPVSREWPAVCKPQRRTTDDVARNEAEGAVVVIDVMRAISNARDAVLAHVPARCRPVRLVASPDGAKAYVTARNSNLLLMFDTARLVSDPTRAIMAEVPVGTDPVGVAVVDAGSRVVVANSNYYSGGGRQTEPLMVIDASRIAGGQEAITTTIPAGAFPRELRLMPDGRTLLVTNFESRTLELVDLARIR